jgi:hypothetical protein
MRMTLHHGSGLCTHQIQGRGTIDRVPQNGLPSTTSSRSSPSVPSCSEPSRPRPTVGRPKDGPALTAPARAGGTFVWAGTKKRAVKPNKETDGV